MKNRASRKGAKAQRKTRLLILSQFSFFALQRVKIAHFWEDFLTVKSTKNTKIRGRDRSISLFVFFAIFAVKSIWLRRSCAAPLRLCVRQNSGSES